MAKDRDIDDDLLESLKRYKTEPLPTLKQEIIYKTPLERIRDMIKAIWKY